MKGLLCAFCGEIVGEDALDQIALGMMVRDHVVGCVRHPLFSMAEENRKLKTKLLSIHNMSRPD